MKKYIKIWIGGFISTFLLPFETWKIEERESIRKLLILRDQLFSRIYAIIWFNIACICIYYYLPIIKSFFIGIISVMCLNGFVSCYRYYKVIKNERSFDILYSFCWIIGLISLLCNFVAIVFRIHQQ